MSRISSVFKKTALALCIGSMLSGCIESSSTSEPSNNEPGQQQTERVSITGFAVKGILAGAIVEAYDITGTVLLATAITNSSGKYTLPALEHEGPILVRLKTSTETMATCDSAVGCGEGIPFGAKYPFNDSAFNLSAVLPDAQSASEQELMVTPITHMAAERALASNAVSSLAITNINTATASLLGLDGIDINTVAPVDITDPTATQAASPDQQLYAALAASIQTIAESDPSSSIADVIQELADDYAEDGGLISNSESSAKITLEAIFSGATEVVEAAEAAAIEEGIILDLDSTETALGLAENEASNAEPDTDVVVLPDPDLEPEPEPELTQSEAVQKGIDLLTDLNVWQDALQEDNQSLLQPFEDQINGAESLLKSIGDQSQALQSFYSMIGKQYTVSECGYFNAEQDSCYYYESYNEFEAGPLVNVVGIIGSLTELAGRLQNRLDDETSFNYSEQIDAPLGINLESLTDLVTVENNAEENIVEYDLAASYSWNESKINTITYVLSHKTLALSEKRNFEITLTQNDFADDSNLIAFTVSSTGINLPNDGLVLSIPTGEASISFASSEERIAFSNHDSELNASYAAITAIDVHLTTQATKTEVSDLSQVVTTGDLAINFNFDKAQDNSTITTLSLSANVSNNLPETINGIFSLTAHSDFNETADEIEGFNTWLNLTDANATFVGNISLTTTDSVTARFNGQVDAEASFFLVNQDEEQIADLGSAKFDGTLTVSEETQELVFTGSAEVYMEAIKTPLGVPFKLADKTQYHANKALLFGQLTAKQLVEGSSASVEVNAAITADIAGLEFNGPSKLNEGDVLGVLKYGLSSDNENHARYTLGLSDLVADIRNNLNAKGYQDIGFNGWISDSDFVADFNASNCALTASGDANICDVTEVYQRSTYGHFETPLSREEKEASMAESDDQSYQDKGVINLPVSALTLTATDYLISPGCNQNEDTEGCNVSITLSASANIPAEIPETDRESFIKGQDAVLNTDTIQYSASCTDQDEGQQCTITKTNEQTIYLKDSLSLDAKNKIILGNNESLGRYISSVVCERLENGNSNCDFNISEDKFYSLKLLGGVALSESERMTAAIAASGYPDHFNQQATGDVSFGSCSELGEDLYCWIQYSAITISLEVPEGIIEYYSDGSSYTYRAQHYFKGTYLQPKNEYEILSCSNYECKYVETSNFADSFSAGVSEENIALIAQGSKYYSNYNYEITECIEQNCLVSLSTNKYVTFPAGLTAEEKSDYLSRVANAKGSNESIYTLANCYTFDDGSESCSFNTSVIYTRFAQVINVENGITLYAANRVNNNYAIPSSDFWAEIDSQFGYIDINTEYSENSNQLSGLPEQLERNVVVRDFYAEFSPLNIETDNAYIEMSAAFSIKAALTGLEDAEVSIFINRIGRNDSEGSIKLINGLRTIDLSLNSQLGFDDPEGTHLSISNSSAEMLITASCATDENDTGVNSHIAECAEGISFQGAVHVGGFKVADLEDRSGLPVFRFSDGTGLDLVMTPNFVVQPSAP